MFYIRPLSDLQDSFSEIAALVHTSQEPVFLTKDGYGDMVVMSMEAYNETLFCAEVYGKLKEAEQQAGQTKERLSHQEVFSDLRRRLGKDV